MNIWREEIIPWNNSSSDVIVNFSEVGSANPPWWPDLTWRINFFLLKCAKWVVRKSHQVWGEWLAAFGNDTSKTWRGPKRPTPARNRVNASSHCRHWYWREKVAHRALLVPFLPFVYTSSVYSIIYCTFLLGLLPFAGPGGCSPWRVFFFDSSGGWRETEAKLVLTPCSFLGQIKSLTYDVIVNFLLVLKMVKLRNAVNTRVSFEGRYNFQSVLGPWILIFCLSLIFHLDDLGSDQLRHFLL